MRSRLQAPSSRGALLCEAFRAWSRAPEEDLLPGAANRWRSGDTRVGIPGSVYGSRASGALLRSDVPGRRPPALPWRPPGAGKRSPRVPCWRLPRIERSPETPGSHPGTSTGEEVSLLRLFAALPRFRGYRESEV